MKTLGSEALPNLPLDIKSLISDGVYALFSVNNGRNNFALIAGEGVVYFLNNAGDIIDVKSMPDFNLSDVLEPLTFSNPGSIGGYNSIRINAA